MKAQAFVKEFLEANKLQVQTVQMNHAVREDIPIKVKELAKELGCSQRRVIESAVDAFAFLVEDVQRQMDHPEIRLDTPKWAFDWAMEQVNAHYDGQESS